MKSGWTSLISSVLYLRMVTRNYIYLNNMYICIYVYILKPNAINKVNDNT
jgi:hypothetical protein